MLRPETALLSLHRMSLSHLDSDFLRDLSHLRDLGGLVGL